MKIRTGTEPARNIDTRPVSWYLRPVRFSTLLGATIVATAIAAGCSSGDGGAATPREALEGYVHALSAVIKHPNGTSIPDPERPLRVRAFFPPQLPAEVENHLRIGLSLTLTLVSYQVQLVDIRLHGPRATALLREASVFQHGNARFPPQDALRRERELNIIQENGRWYIEPPDLSSIRKKR